MKSKSVLKAIAQTYPNIMADIGTAFDKKKIQYKKSQSEIVVKNSTEKTINSVISSLIPEDDKKILLDVVGVNDKVYIRKKCG